MEKRDALKKFDTAIHDAVEALFFLYAGAQDNGKAGIADFYKKKANILITMCNTVKSISENE